MSVFLPTNALCFQRPFNTTLTRALTIANKNSQPIAFKVKTSAPMLRYYVRPNMGRIEPGESADLSFILQAFEKEPPLDTKCRDKFLIQSAIITPEQESLSVSSILSSPGVNDDGKLYQQKLRVNYLPAEGQTLEKEDKDSAVKASISDNNPASQRNDVIEEQSPPIIVHDLPQEQETNYRPSSATPSKAATSQPIYADTEPIPEPSGAPKPMIEGKKISVHGGTLTNVGGHYHEHKNTIFIIKRSATRSFCKVLGRSKKTQIVLKMIPPSPEEDVTKDGTKKDDDKQYPPPLRPKRPRVEIENDSDDEALYTTSPSNQDEIHFNSLNDPPYFNDGYCIYQTPTKVNTPSFMPSQDHIRTLPAENQQSYTFPYMPVLVPGIVHYLPYWFPSCDRWIASWTTWISPPTWVWQ